MKDLPLVSVIITAYNRTDFLKAAIQSVKRQSYSKLEILVIDDGSTTDAIQKLCNSIDGINYYRKENGGISSARNYGIERADGEYLAFLDDDDLFKPHRIEVQLQCFKTFPEVGLVHSAAAIINHKGEPTGQVIGASAQKIHLRSGNVFWNALGAWLPKAPTVLLKKESLGSLRFDENLKAGEDADFYQRYFYHNRIKYIADPLAYYRQHQHEQRLSTDWVAYQGLGLAMFNNFKKMGISNTLVLSNIARKLVHMEMRNHGLAHPNKPLNIPKWKIWLLPRRTLKQYFSGQ